MKKERIGTWVVVLLLALTTLVWAAGQDMKGAFDFWGTVIFKSSGTVTMEGAVTTSGEQTFSNGVFCNDEFVQETYSHIASNAAGTGTDSLTWAFANGNTLYISGSSAFTLTLPQITATQDGYRLLVKNTANAAVRTITGWASGTGAAGTTDYVETTVGTYTDQSCVKIDAIGDWRMWEADFNSTTSLGYWRLVYDGVLDSFDRKRTSPTTLTFVSGAGYTISPSTGNVFLIPTVATDDVCAIHGGGVTITIPSPSASNLGWEPTIVNTTGTSPMALYIDGTQTIGASGATVVGIYDAEGDSVTLGYWEISHSGVSVYVKSDIVDGS